MISNHQMINACRYHVYMYIFQIYSLFLYTLGNLKRRFHSIKNNYTLEDLKRRFFNIFIHSIYTECPHVKAMITRFMRFSLI